MFLLTPSERKVLIFVGILILAGSLLRLYTKNDIEIIPSVSSSRSQAKVVNINTAGLQELMSLPGVGIKTARLIAEHRGKFGGFQTIQDLKKVKGIGNKKAERIKKFIVF